MADLIRNGYFDDDELAPWRQCARNEIGEAWRCLEDEEPDFPRTSWVYTNRASLTDHNWVFLSAYNLRMTDNDAIVQDLSADARAAGEFTLWLKVTPPEQPAGAFYAFICYADHTFGYGKLTRSDLSWTEPTHLTILVEDKVVTKVMLCVVGAVAPWFVNAISMPEAEAKTAGRPPAWHRNIENRLARVEEKVDRLYVMVAKGVRPGRS